MTALDRFLKYVTFSTASDEDSDASPSTARQLDLARALREEMTAVGLCDVSIDECGNVIGTLSADPGVTAPVVAFVAHMDTSPAAPGENVRPRLVHFDGSDIELDHGALLGLKQYPFMDELRGKTLVVADGSTLLGADDKAGVAEIMTMAERLSGGESPHGELRIVFTTDEEIGRGTEGLDLEGLGCQFGYTVDGGALGSYEYENFNAASAKVTVHGVGIHPGSAKNVMKNASAIAMEFHGTLPVDQVPEKTEGRQGFIHLTEMSGDVVEATLRYIIRDHDPELFEEKKSTMLGAAGRINLLYGAGTVEVEIRDSYFNMKEKILPHMHLIERAQRAFSDCGVTPHEEIVRGGTDGAMLTWAGLPCPNLSTGGYNFHGVHEFIPADAPDKMADVLVRLASGFTKNLTQEAEHV